MKNKIKYLIALLLTAFYSTQAKFTENPENLPSTPSSERAQFFYNSENIINIFLIFIFIASIIGFIFSLVQFAIAGGSETSLDRARKFALSSFVGLLIACAGYIIFRLVDYLVIK